MKYLRVAAVLASLVLVVPAVGFAQSTTQAKPAPKARSSAAPAMSATKGVVKSIGEDSLVITRGRSRTITFMLNSSTQRQGDVVVGATVDVRYHMDGKSRVATAIAAQAARSTTRSKSKSTSKPAPKNSSN